MDKVNKEIERRINGTSINHMNAFVWDDDFECYLMIYDDVTIIA